ncbi:MAG TPA: helix-turn-helix domain-containing protein [Vicinamibacterales bacterium]|nr:helix-turn-helix domain-containing protein [Vicinamibacterales bacterium]
MAARPPSRSPCPIARSLDAVGHGWSMLILRDAFYGLTRFDEFQKSLGIAPNMLARRLGELVEWGLLARRPYCHRPLRHEYVLTDRGRDFWPVLVALLQWGNEHLAPEGASVVLLDRATGKPARALLIDAHTGKPVTARDHSMGAGPKAGELVRRRAAFAAAKHENPSLRPEFLAAEQAARAALRRRSERESTRGP